MFYDLAPKERELVSDRFDWRAVPKATRDRWEANAGHLCGEDAWLKGRAAEQKLERFTLDLVNRLKACLESTGGYMGTDLTRPRTDGTIHIIDAVEDVAYEVPAIKHQVFLPSVAHLERNSLVKEFCFWLEHHKHTRYYVATTGTRCQMHQIRRRFHWLHEKISEFRRLLKDKPEFNGIEIVLRVDELTIERTGLGLTFHPHSNLAIHFPYFLGKEKFLQFKTMMDDHFGVHVKDNGPIKEPRELIKYLCKYESETAKKDNTIGILDLSDVELAAFYEVRRGLKPAQSLGSFKNFRRDLREAKHKVVKKFDGIQWKLGVAPKNPAKKQRPKINDAPTANVLVAITDPQPRFRPVLRNCVVVRNFDGDYKRLRDELNLAPLREFNIRKQDERTIQQERRDPVSSWVHTITESPGENFSTSDPPGRVFPSPALVKGIG
jgi:hypothetical protein